MKHFMNLNVGPFNKIKNGAKTVELRLYDEKRQLLNVGDLLEFTNLETKETLLVEILDLCRYDSFDELYKNFDKVSLGYNEDDIANPNDMDKYYTKEKQKKYGVVGIKIKKLEKNKKIKI